MNKPVPKVPQLADKWVGGRLGHIAALAAHPAIGTMLFFLFSSSARAAESGGAEGEYSTLFVGLIVGIGLIGVTALIVSGLALWSRKQDQQSQIMSFCIRHLIHSVDADESREAAEALGHAKDPAAMLVLIEVASDDETEESVRAAAFVSLEKMRTGYRKQRLFIDEALSAVEKADHARLIELLIDTFERSDERYVQSAYLIGREYMRMGNYEDAREWLQTADFRNKKLPLYGNQIQILTDQCVQYLYAEGDSLYEVGRYQDARERYAAASHGLSSEWKRHYAAYLRMACVYCKLDHFQDADQATLRALHEEEDVDNALRLSKLLQSLTLTAKTDHPPLEPEEREAIIRDIDAAVNQIMNDLMQKQYGTSSNP